MNDVHGYVFIPNDFVVSSKLSFTAYAEDWSTNVYTRVEWSQIETKCAIFLPAGGNCHIDENGYREFLLVPSGGSWIMGWNGHYWSSTPYDESSSCYLNIRPDGVHIDDVNRSIERSVRLVQDIK